MMQQFRRDQGQSNFCSAMPELAWDSDQTALQPRMQISLLPPFEAHKLEMQPGRSSKSSMASAAADAVQA